MAAVWRTWIGKVTDLKSDPGYPNLPAFITSSTSSPLLLVIFSCTPQKIPSSSSPVSITLHSHTCQETTYHWQLRCMHSIIHMSLQSQSPITTCKNRIISISQPIKLALSSFLITCCVTAPLLQIKPVNRYLCFSSLSVPTCTRRPDQITQQHEHTSTRSFPRDCELSPLSINHVKHHHTSCCSIHHFFYYGHFQSHCQSSTLLWFAGRSKCFFLQCLLALDMQLHRFPMEFAKVSFIISLLVG